MLPPNIFYTAILMAASIVCLVVGTLVWLYRNDAVGSKPLTAFLLGLSWWDITYAIFWDAFPAPTPYFWLDITLVGGYIVPTAFLIFAIEFAGMRYWLRRSFLNVLMIEPILVFILQWTDPWHNLYFGGKRALNTTTILDAGPVSWANIIYSYALILIAVAILFRAFLRSNVVYRKQVALVLGAAIIPWLAHFVALVSGGGLLPNADATPFIFTITALVIAFALFRYRLLDIVPIAHNLLIENMGEGVLVVDGRNRVVDVNPAARRVLSPNFMIGEAVDKAFADRPDLVARFIKQDQMQAELVFDELWLDLRISPLFDKRDRKVGRLFVWRDITEFKKSQLQLEKLATTDELTLTCTRRHFIELAEAQINRAWRGKHPLSLALLDLDYFKRINDNFGHLAGDKALAGFAKLVFENIRSFDIFSRFGGEEFALLMPETDQAAAFEVVERLRKTVEQHLIPSEKEPFSITFSSGITELGSETDTLEAILRRADHALYVAKDAGRNHVRVWQEA
jgi:diguanylate cyclase (GGDEF)-like protein/PAS domain S-box-containing protein